MLAGQLLRLGILFRIIEKNEGLTTQSPALDTTFLTKIFEKMGLADPAVKQGRIFQTSIMLSMESWPSVCLLVIWLFGLDVAGR